MSNPTLEQIHDLDITDVVRDYANVELKKEGPAYKGLCPFHNEKTPSFKVNPGRGIFKCFGCGEGGDAIAFVMKNEKVSFMEAITDLAKKYNLKPPKQMSDKEKEKFEQQQKQREALKIVNEFAKDFFIKQLKKHKPEPINNRVKPEMIETFEIGFAPDSWNALRDEARKKGYKENLLIDAGLLASKNGKVYDRFRNRMIFPVYDYRGRIIGFSGRDITGGDVAKYINSPESEVFKKGRELYGLFHAKKAIEQNNHAYLVEGNTDVTTLYSIGVKNTTAPLGTAFTLEQATLLKKFCKSVTIIGDGDEAGQKAMVKNAQILIEKGLSAYIIELPKEEDPDSYFASGDLSLFETFKAEARKDFIFWYAEKLMGDQDDPGQKAHAIGVICKLLLNMPRTKADVYVEQLGKLFKPKKQWEQHINELRKESHEAVEKESLPSGVDPEQVERYGFYEYKNRYYFRAKEGGWYPVSNFILKPLFHIKLVTDSSRLFEMTNVYGHKEIVDIDVTSMVSIQNFRKIIEGRGNFLFEGNEIQFMRIKRKLYDNTKTCELIENLGWQKEGFYAFSNGIFNGQWKPIDNKGIVENDGKYFFIPALSDIYKDDKTVFLPERRFKHIARDDVDMNAWSKQFIQVFGDNARIAIGFFLATLFKDYIFQQFKFFPILNAFGPPGTGKSQIAWSMMYLFGEAQNPFNIHNGTKVGLAEHLAEFQNALAWIDEYKNAVDYDKIEMLKGAYDGIGRKKGGIEKGRKTKVSSINAGILITGQEMPTADVALLKRVILLQFSKSEFTEKEQKDYDRLKDMEKAGLSHLTLDILKYRKEFEKDFFKVYDKVTSELGKDLRGVDVEDRIFRNMAIVVAAFRFFEDKLSMNMNYDELRKLARQNIVDQSSFILNSAEIKGFWDTIESAVENRLLNENQDYKFDQVAELKVENSTKKFELRKKIIYLKFSRIYEVYAETMRRTGQHALPKTTLIFYLRNSKEFIGIKKSVRFENHITNAYVFDYDALSISLEREAATIDDQNQASETDNDDLPF